MAKESKEDEEDLKGKKRKQRKSELTPQRIRKMSMTPTLNLSETYRKVVISPKVKKPKELPKIDYLQKIRERREREAEEILGKFYYPP